LNFNEKEILEKIIQYFIDEWIISDKSLTRSDADQILKDALRKSVEKS